MQNKSGKIALFYIFSPKSFGSSGKSSTFAPRFSKTRCKIGVWCNGNTTDSGPVILGSSPSTPTKKRKASIWKPFLFLLFLILCVDSLDLLAYEVHVVFQLLNLAVHLVNEAVALL